MKDQVDALVSLRAPLHQRLPFLPLLMAGIAGILIGGHTPLSSALWLGFMVCARVAWSAGRRNYCFWAFLISAFAVIHLWQGRESPAAQFARSNPKAEVVTAWGTVASEARAWGNRSTFELNLKRLKSEGTLRAASFRVLVDWKGVPPAYGDAVQVTGVLQPIQPPRNPGQFDFASWSELRGIFLRLEVEDESLAVVLGNGEGNFFVSLAARCQQWMKSTLTAQVDDPAISDLLVAMTLGETSALPQNIQEQFRGTGTFHLFSVSGLHVGLLALILWYALKTVGFSRRNAAALIIPILFFYALMTGWKPASVRAAIMTSIVLTGYFANRPPVLLNNFCAAAFLILLGDTNQLFNAGFQLSFAVVAAILLFAEPLAIGLRKLFDQDPFLPDKLFNPFQRFYSYWGSKFATACAVSLSAWLGSLPLTVGYFHLISFTALPANLAAIMISFGIMAVAMLSVISGTVSLGLAAIFNQTNWFLGKILLAIVGFFASLPGSFCYIKLPEYPQPLATLVVFDFGSGGTCYLNANGQSWLIDTGPARMHDSTLLPFLRTQGVQRLDTMILTHGDAAHIGAAALLLDTCSPHLIADNPLPDRSSTRKSFLRQLAERGQAKSLLRVGDTLPIGAGIVLRFLYPPTDIMRSTADDKAMVLQLQVDHTRILLLSDAGIFTENWLMKNTETDLSSDILIKGEPSDGLSGDPVFLQVVAPSVIITPGTPHTEMAKNWNALRREGIKIFRQDQTGAAIIKIFSDRYEVSGFANKEYFSKNQ